VKDKSTFKIAENEVSNMEIVSSLMRGLCTSERYSNLSRWEHNLTAWSVNKEHLPISRDLNTHVVLFFEFVILSNNY